MSSHLDTPYHASSLVLSWYNRKMAASLRIQRTYEFIEAIWSLIYTLYYHSDIPSIKPGICDVILDRDMLSSRVRDIILIMRKDMISNQWRLPDHIRDKMFRVNKEKTFHLQLFERVLNRNSEMLNILDAIYSKPKYKLPKISEQLFRWELLMFYRLTMDPGMYKTRIMKSAGYRYNELIKYIDALISENILKVTINSKKYFNESVSKHTGIMLNKLHPVVIEFNSIRDGFTLQGVR